MRSHNICVTNVTKFHSETPKQEGEKLAYILKPNILLAIRYAKIKDAMDSGKINQCHRS